MGSQMVITTTLDERFVITDITLVRFYLVINPVVSVDIDLIKNSGRSVEDYMHDKEIIEWRPIQSRIITLHKMMEIGNKK